MYRVTTLFSGPLVAGGGINQLYFDEAAGTAAQAQAAVRTFWQAVDDVIHSSVTIQVLSDVELVTEAGGEITGVVATENYTGSGAGTGDPLPAATQGLIRWRTGAFAGGREVRGRTFVPGPTEAVNDTGGLPTSGYQTVLNNAAGNLIASANAELRVFSRTKSLSATVVSGNTWTKWAQLRGRRD